MKYTKRIVCLANSRKMSGRCIAGKEVLDTGYGEWIRPISKRETAEISEEEMRFENGEIPEPLDIIEIPMIEYRPNEFQVENHVIDDQYYWEQHGHLSGSELPQLLDAVTDTLWINGHSSYNGINDRMSLQEARNNITNSLVLVQPERLSISVSTEGPEPGRAKRKVRAFFTLNGHQYRLTITDPKFEREHLKKSNGIYSVQHENVYMCVSIGEPYEGYCYKLVAAIITAA